MLAAGLEPERTNVLHILSLLHDWNHFDSGRYRGESTEPRFVSYYSNFSKYPSKKQRFSDVLLFGGKCGLGEIWVLLLPFLRTDFLHDVTVYDHADTVCGFVDFRKDMA